MLYQFFRVAKIFSHPYLAIAGALILSFHASAQVPIIQPGAPGQPSRQITAQEASDLAGIQFSDGDVKFMQGMISHHSQALDMSILVDGRTNRDTMTLMARRISLSQEDEIDMMQDWLKARDLMVPGMDSQHMAEGEMMPGMASLDEMAELATLQGAAFDTMFLQLMIEHHKGALTMVEDLLGQRGSAQDSVLFEFTSDVTADQASEIDRMNSMLAGFSPDPRVNLRAGFRDAGEASLNMQLLAALPKPDGFFDPANPSGLPMPPEPEKTETLEPDPDAGIASGDSDEETVGQEANSNLVETPASEAVDDENAEPRGGLLNFANTDLLFADDVLVVGNYHGFNAYD
ncbi:MAG: hypothetical protein ACJA2Q_002453, partial [Pseudohongiellaceae bacterium]